ncbi:ATP-binding protein [uncultured Propionibacterium sp.]|uniref:ATP-binding protein n=1 Tax=uncultured Propionibacterium sp. TaxID=218066 RepID=UPI0037DD179F
MPTTADETSTCIDYLARVMKAPWIRDTARAPAGRGTTGAWTGPQHPRAVLGAEVAARETSGAEQRLRAAGSPAVRTLEELDSDHQPAADRARPHRLAAGGHPAEAGNLAPPGPPGTGKTHRTGRPGHRRLPPTNPRRVQHRRRPGHPPPTSPPHRPPRHRDARTRPAPAADHRRGRPPAPRRRRREKGSGWFGLIPNV